MRGLIVCLVIFLSACNGSDTTIQKVPYTDPQVTAKLNALTQALATATHAQAEQSASLNKLTLIGKVHGETSLRMQGEFTPEGISNSVNFGPCADMGVLIGFTNGGSTSSADPLTASYQAFKQCTGYYYEAQVGTGNISVASRIFWDGPNCTGSMYEWEAGGAGYNTQTLQGGIVFLSPVDGTPLAVTSGQTPQPIMIQSAWVNSNPGCQSDVETQLLYSVVPNKISVTGVPNTVGPNFQLSAP